MLHLALLSLITSAAASLLGCPETAVLAAGVSLSLFGLAVLLFAVAMLSLVVSDRIGSATLASS